MGAPFSERHRHSTSSRNLEPLGKNLDMSSITLFLREVGDSHDTYLWHIFIGAIFILRV